MSAESTPVSSDTPSAPPTANSSASETVNADCHSVKSLTRTAAEIVAQGKLGAKSELQVSTSSAHSSSTLSSQSVSSSSLKQQPPSPKQSTNPSGNIVKSASAGNDNRTVKEVGNDSISDGKSLQTGTIVKTENQLEKDNVKVQHSQSLTNNADHLADDKVTVSKSETSHAEEQTKAVKPKGPKTFDKETFVEAPLPATNPWKKPVPVENAKLPEQSIGEGKSETHVDQKKRPVNAVNHRGPPRSPRGSKYNNHPRSHQATHRGDSDRNRKSLSSSKSVPTSSVTQQGKCDDNGMKFSTTNKFLSFRWNVTPL